MKNRKSNNDKNTGSDDDGDECNNKCNSRQEQIRAAVQLLTCKLRVSKCVCIGIRYKPQAGCAEDWTAASTRHRMKKKRNANRWLWELCIRYTCNF